MEQILHRFDVVRLRRFDQTVQIGARPTATLRLGKKPIFAAYDEGSHCILSTVVVDRVDSVLGVADQARPLAVEIMERFAECRFGCGAR